MIEMVYQWCSEKFTSLMAMNDKELSKVDKRTDGSVEVIDVKVVPIKNSICNKKTWGLKQSKK